MWNRTALGLLAVTATAVACGGRRDIAVEQLVQRWAGCPQHERGVRIADDTVEVPVAGNIVSMPEYHDCQKFLSEPGGAFGPRAAIWAAQDLRTAFDGAADSWIAVAEILITAEYKPLRLQPGFNCLYLQRTIGTNDTSFKARVVSLGDSSAPCRDPVAPGDMKGKELRALPFPLPDTLQAADVPPVARWDRMMQGGSDNAKYYVGIRCGQRWCEVGPHPSTGKQNPPVEGIAGSELRKLFRQVPGKTLTNREAARIRDVQGWHDVQELAAVGGKSSSGVTGAAFPQPELDGMDITSFPPGEWVPSAYLAVDRPYNGVPLKLEKGFSIVELCRGPNCSGALASCSGTGSPADPTGPWHARITPISAAGSMLPSATKPYCVRRHPHTMSGGGSGVIPAGAVRWAWNERDESLWIRCAEGCCTID